MAARQGTLVYVHGASDRSVEVADHVARIEAQLALHGMDLAVVASAWGEAAGARLDQIDLAIPPSAERAVEANPQEGTMRWLLRDGPLVELDAMAATADLPVAFSAPPPGALDADQLLGLVAMAFRPGSPVSADVQAAVQAVGASEPFARARASNVPETDLVGATARAVAAAAATGATAAPSSVATDALDLAWNVQSRIADVVLAAATATILAGYVGVDVGPGLKLWATDVIVPQRSRLLHEGALGVADVLFYQRNGEPIRRHVAETLRTALTGPRPVVALGNSMGGIVLVNLLMSPDAPRPDLLVTVGSQAPLLHTFGALAPAGEGLPPFQPWLNIYDRRDLVAFVAAPVWPDQTRIFDVAVDSGLGFPDSHGATYLSLPAVYEAIREHLV